MRKIIVMLIFLLLPISVFASNEEDYNITKYNIIANIENNGNVNVCEYIKIKGTFNGYIRDIFYKAEDATYTPTNINNIQVYDLDTSDMTKGEIFSYDDYAKVGESLKYNIINNTNGPSIKMYNRTNGDTKGFVLCYTLENAILIHNDVAEFYYNFIPSGFENLLKDVEVKVNLNSLDETLKVWAHGALYGNVTKENSINNSYLLASINYVNPGEVVNVRMTFNKNLVSESKRYTNKDALNKIIEEETILADEANKEREREKNIIYFCIIEFVLYISFVIFSVIYCYIKYDKEHKVDFNMEYYRDFPNNYGPEVLEYLIKHMNTSEGYSASILNMIYKKNIIIKETEDKKDYILIKAENFSEPLTISEGLILDFILNNIGNGSVVTLKEIKKYGQTESKARKFLKHFENWKNEVEKNINNYNFFEKKGGTTFGLLLIIFTFLTCFICKAVDFDFLMFLTILIGIIAILYIFNISKKTKDGMLEYKKWMAFKKFLLDFGRFHEKELPEIVLWEKYLVYATVFGIADKVSKTMKFKIESIRGTNADFNDVILMNHMMRSNFTHTMNSTIKNAYNASRSTIASSSVSSGTGSGGGFSGGGGFTGGGGGGGGRGF